MKKFSTRGVVAVAMIAAMGISTPAIAFGASTTSSASNSTHISLSAHTDGPWKAYRKAESNYLQQLRVIRHTFQNSVNVARRDYWAAIRASKGASDAATA